jgi:hypothetical protein
MILLVFVVLFIFLSSFGSKNFGNLQVVDQAENLRWLSSALIQAYASILALVPVLSLALMSFSSSGYPSRLVKRLWESPEMHIFFIAIFACIIYCYVVLVSIPGPSSSISFLKYNLYIEITTIFGVVLVLYLFLDKIWKLVDVDIIEEIFKDLKKRIQSSERPDDVLEDYFSLLVSVAENKDLSSLRVGIDILFDLICKDAVYCEQVGRMLEDIRRQYWKAKEYFCLGAVNRMIDRGYERFSRSDG